MRKERAKAEAICRMIDKALKQGYPKTLEGLEIMRLARNWVEEMVQEAKKQGRPGSR